MDTAFQLSKNASLAMTASGTMKRWLASGSGSGWEMGRLPIW